jgi:hypothetical protein
MGVFAESHRIPESYLCLAVGSEHEGVILSWLSAFFLLTLSQLAAY